jgi:heme/copper-type cytochrome/quinol oxidase subunit 2
VSSRPPHRTLASVFVLTALSLGLGIFVAGASPWAQSKKDFSVSAHKYGFKVSGSDRAEIRVKQDDLVRITFSTEDIPHSFTITEDPYRIMRRAEPGRPVTFDFRADKPGSFPFRCTLTVDDRCKEMQGMLIVEGAKWNRTRFS